MTHTYNITGMTCGNCVAKAKSQLLMLGDITEANVKLTAPQATITMQKHIPVTVLQDALSKAGALFHCRSRRRNACCGSCRRKGLLVKYL